MLDFEWSATAAARHLGDEALAVRAAAAAERLLGPGYGYERLVFFCFFVFFFFPLFRLTSRPLPRD
jgi:hypothetical protein